MSQYNQQHQAPVAYPPPPTSYPPPADSYNGPYVMAPPPMGYPTKDYKNQGQVPTETTSRVLLDYVAAGAWTFVSDEYKSL
ncbi:hypothetical protein Sango_1347800 [Sesamum angolense]|uniref:Uncharacterized protein n=1 Tax=Sesamum angolense TaxID=2727404 RepID=A0AAE1WS87_9LAMI|nr:hypothetical protein Sango_1347800 [Sesamum angolense]